MECIKLCLIALLAIKTSSGFGIVESRVKDNGATEGKSIELFCAVDGYYEWCTFRRHDGKVCDFEWKREVWNLTLLECKDFEGRFALTGSYDKYECGLKLDNVQLEDAGNWTCELESYHRGYSRGDGTQDKRVLAVEVRPMTTTTISTTTTSTTTTTTSPNFDSQEDNESDSEDGDENANNSKNEDLNGKDSENNESSSAALVVIITLLILIAGLGIVIFGLHYKRKLPPQIYTLFSRTNWKPVAGNEELPVNDEDDKKSHPSIVKNGSSNGSVKSKPVELGPVGETATLDPTLMTVTWTTDEKSEIVKDNKLIEEESKMANEEEKKIAE